MKNYYLKVPINLKQSTLKKCIIFLLLLINVKLMSQTKVQDEYYFRRQEMVAGFNFSGDGKFQFFYSYGAVDRNATGTYSISGDTLKLKSDKAAGRDFTISDQSKQPNGYTVVFKDANKYLVKDILCIFFVDGKKRMEYSDNNGEVNVDIAYCDTIYVEHPLFPDIFTLVKDKKNDNNRFTLTLNPSLTQISFKGIDFKIVDDKMITCVPNYFMEMDNIKFIKE